MGKAGGHVRVCLKPLDVVCELMSCVVLGVKNTLSLICILLSLIGAALVASLCCSVAALVVCFALLFALFMINAVTAKLYFLFE
jgi:hypothetical protein